MTVENYTLAGALCVVGLLVLKDVIGGLVKRPATQDDMIHLEGKLTAYATEVSALRSSVNEVRDWMLRRQGAEGTGKHSVAEE